MSGGGGELRTEQTFQRERHIGFKELLEIQWAKWEVPKKEHNIYKGMDFYKSISIKYNIGSCLHNP